MICEVEAVTGQKIPQSALRTAFTIRELAATMMGRIPATGELITCAKQGRGTPFFFCHGDYATRGLYALRLVEMLMCDQPVYLLHPFLDPDPELSIEETARACLPYMLEANPTDAFILGGHCNGALLAWEIARQLETSGRQVQLVAMIEAPSLNARRLLRRIAQLNGFIVAVAPRQLSRKFALDAMRAVWAKMGFPRYGPHTRAVVNYVPPKIVSHVVCLISDESRLKVEYSWRHWTKLAGNVSCHYIAGTHLGCITKNVGDTARLLGQLIKQPREIESAAVG